MADLVTRLTLNDSDFQRKIKGAQQSVTNFKSKGDFTKMAGGFAKLGGAVATAALVMDQAKKSFDLSISFEKSLSSLRALTGLGTDEMKFFRDEAIRLGATTTQTASEVVTSFKIIGSQIPELLKSKYALSAVTEAAIILAEAAEISVTDAAKALTGSINQMGVSSGKATDYINILAAASQQGSADIPYLNAAIEKAGGAASSVGVEFHELVSAIEAIAPKITEASTAGLALRNIFLTLEASSDKNLKPSVVGATKAIENLAAMNLDATKMTKMFGKENVTAALAITNAKDAYVDFTKTLNGTNTALEQQKINTDNVDGALKGLGSQWEGFLLNVNRSNGALKSTIQLLTGAVKLMNGLFQADSDSAYSKLREGAYDKMFNSHIDQFKKSGMSVEDAAYEAQKIMNATHATERARLQDLFDKDASTLNRTRLNSEIAAYERSFQKIGHLSEKKTPKPTPTTTPVESDKEGEKSKVSNLEERKLIQAQYQISDSELEYMDKKIKVPSLGIPVKFDLTNASLSDLTKDVSKEADELKKLDLSNKILNQKDAEYTQAGLDAISSTVSTMGGVVGGAAGSWLQYGAGIVSSVAAALPALAALFPKLMGVAIADSAANAPWFMKVMNVAAVSAGVIGAVGAIPKLANGGIAYGNSIVNVGEYQGASANPEVIAPLNKLKAIIGDTGGVSGDVRFRIRGNDLEGILNKNNRKNNRT